MNGVTANIQRGCGRRKAGGIYIECPLGDGGSPLEDFLLDPPVEIPAGLALAAQGVAMLEKNGVTHVVDWVGASHYPNVADFLEEVRRYGLSRRIPKTADFAALSVESRILLVHPRAILDHPETYRCRFTDAQLQGQYHICPQNIQEHQRGGVMCAGIWWEDIHGAPDDIEELGPGSRITRTMPAFSYGGNPPAPGANTAAHPGFFASFPIAGLAVVQDPVAGRHEEAAGLAAAAGVPLEVVAE